MIRGFSTAIALVGLGTAIVPLACSSDPAETPSPKETLTQQRAEALLSSSWAAEKLIPLRFVHLVSCIPTNDDKPCSQQRACGDDQVNYDAILNGVTRANQIFKAAGIQFYVAANERRQAPSFSDLDDFVELNWATAYNELHPIFPFMPSDAWLDGTNKRRYEWLQAIAAVYARENQILVYLVEDAPSNNARQPEQGRNVIFVGATFCGAPYIFAHELGHYLGLPHTWANPSPPTNSAELFGGVDPETLQARKKADLWDFVYKPGTSSANPHVFYDDFASAWGTNGANESNLVAIQRSPCAVHCANKTLCSPSPTCPSSGCCQCDCAAGECDSCIDVDNPRDGTQTCHVGTSSAYSETYTNGAPALKGIARVIGGVDAVNVMSYRGGFSNSSAYFISDSQIHLMRKYLRWEVPISEQLAHITQGRNTSYGWSQNSGRTELGSFGFRDPLAKLDFNGDGLRDIGVWIPPTTAGTAGQLMVLLSPTFSTRGMINTSFGRLGDIPVPADYDADGKTDFAVYQPGGGVARDAGAQHQSYWRWCLTHSTPTVTNCSSISQTTCHWTNCQQYGERQDVPTPGLEFDGILPNELSVYRPEQRTWYWKQISGTGQLRTMSPANVGAMPLPGLYDSDNLTDLVLWDARAATFYWRRSEQSWNTQGSRYWPGYAAYVSGTAEQRGGAIPMPIFRPVQKCTSNPCVPITVKRRTFSLWRPYYGDWSTIWDPFGTNTIDTPCAFGNDRVDEPFSGFDRNGDSRADMGIFRAKTASMSQTIYTRLTVAGACNGQNLNRGCSRCGAGTRVFAVGDMTGDGREEIIILERTMRIRWLTSESDYATTGGDWDVNNTLAVFL